MKENKQEDEFKEAINKTLFPIKASDRQDTIA